MLRTCFVHHFADSQQLENIRAVGGGGICMTRQVQCCDTVAWLTSETSLLFVSVVSVDVMVRFVWVSVLSELEKLKLDE